MDYVLITMEKINKALRYTELFLIYGKLLSSTQKEILESYFCYDLSISEIALERGVSRAAVEDALQKGIQKLEEYEESLSLLNNRKEILEIIAKLKETALNPEQIKYLEEIERRMK